MAGVTIPAQSGDNIFVAPGTGDVLHLAAQIGALLSTIKGADALGTSTISAGGSIDPPPFGTNTTSELIFNPTLGTDATVQPGWQYVVNLGGPGSTLTASDTALIGGATSPGSPTNRSVPDQNARVYIPVHAPPSRLVKMTEPK